MLVQTAFTLHLGSNPLDALPDAGKWLWTFRVPSEAKPNLWTALSRLGYRRDQMFPDLDNLSWELARSRFL